MNEKIVNLLENILEFNSRFRPRSKADKKSDTFESVNNLFKGQELTFNAFKNEIFPLKSTRREGLKILAPKQIFQRLPIALETCISKSRQYFRKFIKRSQTNCLFFASIKRNY